MTRQSTFKKKIRARMAETGERYAAARLAPLRASPLAGTAPTSHPRDARVLTDLGPLASALQASGVLDPATGRPFTEARLYGLSGGPGFMGFVFVYKGVPPMLTWTLRSFSVASVVVGRALEHGGIPHELAQTGSADRAAKALAEVVDSGRVAHIAVDQARLPWLGMDPVWRGQWARNVDVVGRDGEAWVIQDGGLWHLDDATLREARAGVKKAKHAMWTFGGQATVDPAAATRDALLFYARNQREAPYPQFARSFGLAGLQRAAEDMADARTKAGWERVFATGPHLFRALWRLWECTTVELTAPAGGRPLFAEVLRDAGHPEVAAVADASGERFEAFVDAVIAAGGEVLAEGLELTERLDEVTRSGDPGAPAEARSIRAERTALAERFTPEASERRAILDDLAERVRAIHAAEVGLVEAVEAL
ncbi:MAG: hypothetical protein H6734_06210 [Alphaproteobacteria bacterium]|nr:hypothetical protein [Alphaproteobacteria bacterium]